MKKLLACFLVGAMLATSLPAFADENTEPTEQDNGLVTSSELAPQNLLLGESAETSEELISATEVGADYFKQTIETYAEGDANWSDPQISGYTDADFFGVWDGSAWTTESLLNYEAFPEIAEVETAAKAGDYAAAKASLLKHYKERYADTTFGKGSSSAQATVNKARLNLENVSSSRTVADLIKVTEENQSFSVNVTDIVKAAVTDTGISRASFALAALRKDGCMAVIQSKESGEGPSLTVTVNGRNRTYEPVADAYFVAGADTKSNFGTEPVLLVEESYTSIGGFKPSRVDSYTKRSAMLFDFSDINIGDTVSNARLEFSGKIMQSNNPTYPDTLPSYKDIIVMDLANTQWTDEDATWNSVNIDGAVENWNGEYEYKPSGGVLSAVEIADSALKVYFATEEEAYAKAALRMVVESMKKLWVNGDMANQTTLAVSNTVSDFTNEFADILKLPNLTPDQFCFLMKFIHMTTEYTVNTWTNSEETNNWGTANAVAVAGAAICYPEFRAASAPLSSSSTESLFYGGWLEVGKHRMKYKANQVFFEDGSCNEVSLDYAKYNFTLLQGFFDKCNHLKLNAHDIVDEETISLIEQMGIYMMDMSNPIGGSWQQGDDNKDYTRNVLSNCGVLMDVFDNPNLKWLYSDKTKYNPPEYLSTAYDVGRKAVLRSGWEKEALAVQINADAAQKSHGHGDDLGLNFFAYGKMLLADPRQPNYSTNQPVTAWLYSRGHNTVEINGVVQRGSISTDMTITNAEGEEETLLKSDGTHQPGSLHPEDREFNSMYNYIKAETYAYKNNERVGADFDDIREVFMPSSQFVIVTDYLHPDHSTKENTYSQYWHSIPGANMTVDDETGIAQTHFSTGANLTIAPVNGENKATASKHIGWYVNGNTFADYARYEKKGNDTVTFNTVLYPTTATDKITVTTSPLTTDLSEKEASAFSMEFANENTKATTYASYYNLHDKTKKQMRSFGDYSSDGTLAYVQKTGENLEEAVLRGGSALETTDGRKLISSDSDISDLGVRWNAGDVYLYTSKNLTNESFSDVEEPTVNLALGKNSSGSAHFESSLPQYAFDGDESTSWTSPWDSIGGEYPWLSVDLGAEKQIARIAVLDNSADLTYTFYYADESGAWKEAEPVESYQDPLSASDKPRKIYEFAPFTAKMLKMCADSGLRLSVYEFEVYSATVNTVSLYDLSVYAPEADQVYLNDEPITVYQNGDYIVFDEEKVEEESGSENGNSGNSGTTGSESGKHHGSGGSGGGSGSGSAGVVVPSKPSEPTENQDPFSAELSGHWGETEIRFMIEKGIVQGLGDTLALKNAVTRAEFAALLVRALGLEEMEYNGVFSDVSGEEWYAGILAAAEAAGLLEGSDGKANPNEVITREQMAKMLVSAYEQMGNVIDETAQTAEFSDSEAISSWAEAFIGKAVAAGLMNGMDNGLFVPQGTALREQAFVAVARLLQK